jgi:LmbE family N-acetylglucosaminyl deacetylase
MSSIFAMLAISAPAMIENVTVGWRDSTSTAVLDSLCAARDEVLDVPRVTVVCAHPDDEVIGAGGRLPHLRGVNIVHVTDGAPHDMSDAITNGFTSRDAYARARAAERERALALARIGRDRIVDIGIVDQEVSFTLVELTHRLTAFLDRDRPDVVLTHAYEGGHPDHDATAFAVHQAIRQIQRRDGGAPIIVELTGYHWFEGGMRTSCFLPDPRRFVRAVMLGSAEQQLKREMFACYASQQRVLASFAAEVERFRVAPTYDFTRPPHEGRLFYEWFNWRVDGAAWRRLARRASSALGEPTRC